MKESAYNIYIENVNSYLCFNCITSALIELEKSRIINNKLDLKTFSDEEIEFLLTNSYILNDDDDEIESLKLLHKTTCFNSHGLNLIILPTLDCQAKCSYCFQPREKIYMLESTVDNILTMINNYYQNTSEKNLAISWFGGEPMLENAWKCMEYFYNNLHKIINKFNLNYYTSIISNGEYFNNDNVAFLKENKLEHVQITFDGSKKIHNKIKQCNIYDKALNNINLLNNSNIRVGIRVNLSQDYDNNIEDLLEDLAKRIENKSMIDMHFSPVFKFNDLCDIKTEFSNSDFAKLELACIESAIIKGFNFHLPIRNNSSCQALHTSTIIFSPEGKQYLCNNSIYDNEEYANINDIKFSNKKNYYKYLSYDPFEDHSCLICKIFPICKGGCVKERINGKKKCNHRKENIKQYIKLLNNYGQK